MGWCASVPMLGIGWSLGVCLAVLALVVRYPRVPNVSPVMLWVVEREGVRQGNKIVVRIS